MFKELTKYKIHTEFTFTAENDLAAICNAPNDQSGVYLVYAAQNEEKELLFIGSTGTVHNEGDIKHRIGGIYDRIVNGSQFGKSPRYKSWPIQMKKENIESLEIHSYATFSGKTKHIPTYVEGLILQKFLDANGRLPRWNIAF